MAKEPATVTFQVRPGGSHRVEKNPESGEEKLVLVEPDTSDNENPGGNVPEGSTPAKAAKGRK